MPRPRFLTTSDPTEVGRIARSLRLELGLSLRDVQELTGIDYSNLSKAERGSATFEATARKAVGALAAERERRRAEDPSGVDEAKYRLGVEIRLPNVLRDVVDRVREEARRSRFELFHGALASRGIPVHRSEDDPAVIVVGDTLRINLDSLVARLPKGLDWRAWSLRSATRDGDLDLSQFERDVEAIAAYIRKPPDKPMT